MPQPQHLFFDYRYGFNGMEKDDEVKGNSNSYDFGARMHDPRLGRFMSLDPERTLLVSYSPYQFALNTPIQAIDDKGEFPIFINGNTGSDSERASPTYWDGAILSPFYKYGYKMHGTFKGNYKGESRFSGDYLFVDGNKGALAGKTDGVAINPGTRSRAGQLTAKVDAEKIWSKLKESVNEKGEITERIQIISHSRGGAFGNGYTNELRNQIAILSDKEGIGFAYDEGLVIDLVIHLAPHQSNQINVPNFKTTTIGVSHQSSGLSNDLLSGDDVSGDIINIQTSTNAGETGFLGGHKNKTFRSELPLLLKQFYNNGNEGKNGTSQKYDGFDNKLPNQNDKIGEN